MAVEKPRLTAARAVIIENCIDELTKTATGIEAMIIKLEAFLDASGEQSSKAAFDSSTFDLRQSQLRRNERFNQRRGR